VKRTLTTVNNCFKSLKCPSNGNYSQADHIWCVSALLGCAGLLRGLLPSECLHSSCHAPVTQQCLT
jgi:hypothetical protein